MQNIKNWIVKHIAIIVITNIGLISVILSIFVVFVGVLGTLDIVTQNEEELPPIEIVELYKSSPLTPPYFITEEYGHYTGGGLTGGHFGTDMSAYYGANVMAVLDGVVTYATNNCYGCIVGYGNYVTIEHTLENGEKLYTRYGHLDKGIVEIGQNISKGQVIGFQGNTGFSTGTHLHFEVRITDDYNHDNTRNARSYFDF